MSLGARTTSELVVHVHRTMGTTFVCVILTRITYVYVYAVATDATRFARGVGAVVVYVYVSI